MSQNCQCSSEFCLIIISSDAFFKQLLVFGFALCLQTYICLQVADTWHTNMHLEQKLKQESLCVFFFVWNIEQHFYANGSKLLQMVPKKSHKLLGQKKILQLFCDKKILQPLRKNINHATALHKKFMQPLGTKQFRQPLSTKKITQLTRIRKILHTGEKASLDRCG